jgi:hypothetical protein
VSAFIQTVVDTSLADGLGSKPEHEAGLAVPGVSGSSKEDHMQLDVIGVPRSMGGVLAVIGHMLARGEMVAAELPSEGHWTPE